MMKTILSREQPFDDFSDPFEAITMSDRETWPIIAKLHKQGKTEEQIAQELASIFSIYEFKVEGSKRIYRD